MTDKGDLINVSCYYLDGSDGDDILTGWYLIVEQQVVLKLDVIDANCG